MGIRIADLVSDFGSSHFGFTPRQWIAIAGALWLALAFTASAQPRPYIGYTYPAGGQQGTTLQIRLGGQGLDDVDKVLVTGAGVTARVVEYHRRLNNQEVQLLNEQLRELRRATTAVASARAPSTKSAPSLMAAGDTMMMMAATDAPKVSGKAGKPAAPPALIAKLEKRTREFVQTPACASLSSLVMAEVTIAPDAEPGFREIRLATPRGVSNPLVFHIGQVPEFTRKAMLTATIQVLGKEASALRKRPADEAEVRVTLPGTVNGQIASGEVNRYRFAARKGQRLVLSTLARQLIPYIADAVPGWFQPMLTLYDAQGKELAFADDYRFKPDPVILFEVPQDGEYVFAITDAIYRGREDFVYRITAGELPFVTSLFPLGAQAGASVTPKIKGWNLQDAALTPPAKDAEPGIHTLTARSKALVSNPLPFALDKLPTSLDKETNNTQAAAQKVTLPVVINGRIDKPDDWDVFQFAGKSNDTIVAEVYARRLDSALDSVIKLTDARGTVLAFSDDREDLAAGVNTHHADSYLLAKLPATGTYYLHIGDTARKGGDEYGYCLRLSPPRPDFELRVVPSSVSLRTNSTAAVTVYAQRRDGFTGPIKLALKDPPAGFSAAPITLAAGQNTARFTFKGSVTATKEPVDLAIVGSVKLGEKEIVHEAVPAEDRMQAFLWRHLVTASDLKVLVFDPGYQPPPRHVVPVRPPSTIATNAVMAASTTAPNAPVAASVSGKTNAPANTNATSASVASTTTKPKFTKQQVTSRLRQLKLLFEEGLLTEDFYCDKVAECEAAQ